MGFYEEFRHVGLNQEVDPAPPKRLKRSRIFLLLIGVVLVWAVLAYLLVPLLWDGYARVDPALDDTPRITQTGDHHPADPLNVELIGTAAQLQAIMKAADWYTAAALGVESDVEIAADTIL